jgi:hypothetical protein
MVTLTLVLLLLTSRLRAFIERHAVRADLGELLPYFRFIRWGWYGGIPFVQIALPSWSCELDLCRRRWQLAQLVVAWSSVRGWFHFYRFTGDQ